MNLWSNDNVVQGNYVTHAAGTLPGRYANIGIRGMGTIGGTVAGARNVFGERIPGGVSSVDRPR